MQKMSPSFTHHAHPLPHHPKCSLPRTDVGHTSSNSPSHSYSSAHIKRINKHNHDKKWNEGWWWVGVMTTARKRRPGTEQTREMRSAQHSVNSRDDSEDRTETTNSPSFFCFTLHCCQQSDILWLMFLFKCSGPGELLLDACPTGVIAKQVSYWTSDLTGHRPHGTGSRWTLF